MENPCPYHAVIVNEVKKIAKSVEQLQMITVKNGSQKALPIQDLLAELWESSIILRDFTKFHVICIKYHLYKIFFFFLIFFVLFAFGISIKDIIINLFT